MDVMMTRAKGANLQDEEPKAQVFKMTYDPAKTPIQATGSFRIYLARP
jgi:hypothetical protein